MESITIALDNTKKQGKRTYNIGRKKRNKRRHRKASKLNYANVNRICLAVGKPRLATDPSGNVVKLTKHIFNRPEYNLLGKNLNFCLLTLGNFNSTTL